MDKLFTRFSDWFSEFMGIWQVFLFFFFLLIGWIWLGFPMNFSDTWQLIANTPTTWIELFLGLAVLASANRNERLTRALHEKMDATLRHVETIVEQIEEQIKK